MKTLLNSKKATWAKLLAMAALVLFNVGYAYAAGTGATDITSVANDLTGQFGALAKLVTAISYIAGLGFALGAIFKFKAHKDNPTQVPIGTPIALLFVGIALMFLPQVFKIAGQSIFGNTQQVGGVSGVNPFNSAGQ